MPSVSKKQQKFMGIVRAIQKGDAPASKFSKKAKDVAKSMKGKDVKKYASTKHKGLPTRVKSENKLFENPAAIAAGVRAAMARAQEKELSAGGGKKVMVKTALRNKSHPQHKQAKGIIQRIKDKAKSMLSKSKKKKSEPKKQSKSDANFYARQFGGKTESVNKNKIEELKTKAKLTKDKVKKINKYIWSSPKRIVTQSQYNRMQNYNKLRKNGIDYVGTAIDGKLVFLPVVIESTSEGFGGELKGADKKKFEKARKENAEQLGYTLTGTSDVKVVNESKYKGYDYKRQNRKDGLPLIVPALRKTFSNMKDLKKYIDKHGKMESVNEAIEPAGIMAKINKIVQSKQAAKIDGVLMDMFSANIMMRIFNAVNDKAKKDMNKGTMRQVKVILHKVMKQNKVKGY